MPTTPGPGARRNSPPPGGWPAVENPRGPYAGGTDPQAGVGAASADELTLFDAAPYRDAARMLHERFIVPPFSILDSSQLYWQRRKRNWLSLGIKSEVGRDVQASFNSKDREDFIGKAMEAVGPWSVFDPVLCELVYRWWCPADGMVLDPFAGGSVRGIVAAMMGRSYRGVELRPEQVAANWEQAGALDGLYPSDVQLVWEEGDSAEYLPDVEADLIFSCPPYGNLEVYSDDPRDLSAMERAAFERQYRRIIGRACERLKPDRFACFTVGNYRGSRGALVDLVGETIEAFGDAGLDYYGDVIFATPAASIALLASNSFAPGRKPMKRHQYVLVFVKGSWKRAAQACEEFLPR
jgi:hypothetical protein